MINLLIIVGSPRLYGTGYHFSTKIKDLIYHDNELDKGEINIDIMYLSDISYENCVGCTQCFINGKCALREKDSYDFDKMMEKNDGIILLIPTYLHQMPGKLKNCFDRMAYRFHEFPLIGKKVLNVTYTASNGANKLSKYMEEMFTILGAEIVDSIVVYEISETLDSASQRIYCSVKEMINKIKNKNYSLRRSQENLFVNLKSIVQNELENGFSSYKQERWNELLKFNSLEEYIKEKYISKI